MKILALVLCLALTTGCATMHRHPLATKMLIGGTGIAIGGTLGYLSRPHYCHYTYDGQPYYGTSCPAPKN